MLETDICPLSIRPLTSPNYQWKEGVLNLSSEALSKVSQGHQPCRNVYLRTFILIFIKSFWQKTGLFSPPSHCFFFPDLRLPFCPIGIPPIFYLKDCLLTCLSLLAWEEPADCADLQYLWGNPTVLHRHNPESFLRAEWTIETYIDNTIVIHY